MIIKYFNLISKYLVTINTLYFKNIGTFTCIPIYIAAYLNFVYICKLMFAYIYTHITVSKTKHDREKEFLSIKI